MKTTSKIGHYFYYQLLFKMNTKNIRDLFAAFLKNEPTFKKEGEIPRDEFQRILLEMLVISLKEPIPFTEDNYESLFGIWEEVITGLPRECRISGAFVLSDDEIITLKQRVNLVEKHGLAESQFLKELKLELSLIPYRMGEGDHGIVVNADFLPTATVNSFLDDVYPKSEFLDR